MDSGLFGFWLPPSPRLRRTGRFGSVTGFFKPAPSPKPRQKPKILAAHRYIFSVNALANRHKPGGPLENRLRGDGAQAFHGLDVMTARFEARGAGQIIDADDILQLAVGPGAARFGGA